MKIGELSRATGTNIETIRYYERIGLLPAPDRTAANYRSYTGAHRSRLSFVRHSRELGFTIEEIRSLLDLSDDPARDRSEEHTSELQSLMRISYAVFCLKKNKQ